MLFLKNFYKMIVKSRAQWAFTLSEVLVTLGIIGVVSAMTVPTLMRNHQRQVYVTQLRKVHSEITQALETLKTDKRAVDLMDTPLRKANGPEYFFKNYMKTSSISSNVSDCFADVYSNINGDSITLDYAGGKCAVLLDGAAVHMSTTWRYNNIQPLTLNFAVDTNGKQGPNILGRDLFTFAITKDNNLWYGGDLNIKVYAIEKFDRDCTNSSMKGGDWGGNYDACMARVVYDGWAMDY